VEDQLSGLRILEQESGAGAEGRRFGAALLDLSNQRYKGGVTSYLEVLTAEATLIQNQRTAIDLQTRQFVDSVGLVRSLGGGWDTTQLPGKEAAGCSRAGVPTDRSWSVGWRACPEPLEASRP
jgi:outer membrane protein TolC